MSDPEAHRDRPDGPGVPTVPWSVRRPGWALAALTSLAVLGASYLMVAGVRVDEDTGRFLDRGAEAFRAWKRLGEAFGQESRLLLAMGQSGPVDGETLRALSALDADLRQLDRELLEAGRTQRLLVLEVDGWHQSPVARRVLLGPSPAEIASLPLLQSLLSKDRSMVFVAVKLQDLTAEEGRVFATALRGLQDRRTSTNRPLAAAGGPTLDAALAAASGHQGSTLFPLLGVVTVLTLMVLLRSWVLGLIALFPTVITLPVLLAIMQASGFPLNLLTTGLPVILLVLGSTVSLHVLSAMVSRPAGADRAQDVALALRQVLAPAATASVTTALGFCALGISPIGPVAELGLFAGLGVLMAFAAAVLGLPAFASLGALAPRPRAATMEAPVPRRPAWVIGGAATAAGLGVIGCWNIGVDSSATAFLPRNHPVVRDYHRLEAAGAPLSSLEVALHTMSPLVFASPDLVGEVAKTEGRLRQMPDVASVASLVDGLALLREEMEQQMAGNEAASEFQETLEALDSNVPADVPEDLRKGVALAPIVALLAGEGEPPRWFADLGESDRTKLRDAVRAWVVTENSGGGLSRLRITLDHVDARRVREAVARAEAPLKALAEVLPSGRVVVTGAAPLALGVQTTLIESQVGSLTLAILLVGAVLAVALGSLRLALLASVPNLLPLIALFGGLGWMGISLDAATVMVGAIALGIAVDDTVHVLAHYDPVQPPRRAVGLALGRVKGPVIITSLMTALGFSTLGFSDFVPMARFGLLTAGVMVVALVADLWVLPALLLVWPPERSWAEMLRSTGRARFSTFGDRVPHRWFLPIKSAWMALEHGHCEAALQELDGLLGRLRSVPSSRGQRRAVGAATYWRSRALEAMAAQDPADAALRQASAVHQEELRSRYPELHALRAASDGLP